MKLSTRILIAFLIIILVPVALTFFLMFGVAMFQGERLLSVYGIDVMNLTNEIKILLIDALFCEDTSRVCKEDGAYLINTDDFLQRGFSLSEEALQKIYCENFRRLIGGSPAPLNARRIHKECRRIQTMLKIMGFFDKSMTPDLSVAKNAAAFFHKKK